MLTGSMSIYTKILENARKNKNRTARTMMIYHLYNLEEAEYVDILPIKWYDVILYLILIGVKYKLTERGERFLDSAQNWETLNL